MHPAEADARRLMPPRKSILPRRQAIMPHYRANAMQPASRGAIQMAHANNAAHPNDTFFTPHDNAIATRMGRQNNPLGALGDHAENFLQLRQFGKQLTQQFDPRTKAGLIQDAAMFYGGPGEDTTSVLNREMPGQFEKFSIAKSSAGGHLSSDQMLQSAAHDAWVARNHPNAQVRMEALQRLHDQLFGGEVHAKGEIPGRPNEQSMESLNANRAKVREQLRQQRLDAFNKRAAERQQFEQQKPGYDAAAKHQEAISNTLRNNGIHPRMDDGRDLLWDHLGRGPNHPDFAAEHPARFNMGVTHTGDLANPRDVIAQRQAVLSRFYAKQAFNHQN